MKFSLSVLLFIGLASIALAQPNRSARDVNDVVDAAKVKYDELIKKAKEIIQMAKAKGEQVLNDIKAEDGKVMTAIAKMKATMYDYAAKGLNMALSWVENSKEPINNMIGKLESAIQSALDMIKDNEDQSERAKRDVNEVMDQAKAKYEELKAKAQELVQQAKAKGQQILDDIKAEDGMMKTSLRRMKAKMCEYAAKTLEWTLKVIDMSKGPVDKMVAKLEGAIQSGLNMLEDSEEEPEEAERTKRDVNEVMDQAKAKYEELKAKAQELIQKAKAKGQQMLDEIKAEDGVMKTSLRQMKAKMCEYAAKTLEWTLKVIDMSKGPVDKMVAKLEGAIQSGLDMLNDSEEEPEEAFRVKREIIPEIFREKILKFFGDNHAALVEKSTNLLERMVEKRDAILDKMTNNPGNFAKQKLREGQVKAWNKAIEHFESAIEKFASKGDNIDNVIRKVEGYVESVIGWFFKRVEIEDGGEEAATFVSFDDWHFPGMP